MPDPIGTADLAHEAGVSRQMIARWSREGLEEAAKLGRGKWDREVALSWIADRREDSPNLNGAGITSSDLAAARKRLYDVQAEGGEIRNRMAERSLVPRSDATGAFSQATAECIAAGDAWARDHTTPASAPLVDAGLSAAKVIALKAELWNELRTQQADAVRRVESDLADGGDVGSTPIRLSRRMG